MKKSRRRSRRRGRRRAERRRRTRLLLSLLVSLLMLLGGYAAYDYLDLGQWMQGEGSSSASQIQTGDSQGAYGELHDNQPDFTDQEKENTDPFEYYSDLDALGRCGQAYANICQELMPTEERGKIGQVRPSGWHTVKYNGLVEGNYLYNRCHLIGYQLAGENANEKNLITGTRYMNTVGMLPFENQIADYVHETGNHVLYRVTPDFQGNNLVASGVEMEAWSVEDGGQGVCFHVYCYNIQPGIGINYADGDSWLIQEEG